MVGVFAVSVGDQQVFWTENLPALIALLAESGVAVEADNIPELATTMTGSLAASVVIWTTIVLLLGSSWASAVQDGDFAGRFRSLRLGYVIGGLAALAGVAGFAGVPLNGLLLLFGAAFMFQGFAVASWWSGRLGWPRGWWLGFVIVPMFVPNALVLAGTLFAAIGFVDNWYGLRRQSEDA